MHSIFYLLAVVGVFGCPTMRSARDVDADKAVVNLLQRAVDVDNEVLQTDVDVHNETIVDVLNETTTINRTTVHRSLDLAHPIVAMEAFYEHSRERIYHWMEQPYAYLMVMSALIGMLSAFVAVFLFCLVNWMCNKCYAKKRQRRFVCVPNQLDDGKKLIESRVNDSDNDLI